MFINTINNTFSTINNTFNSTQTIPNDTVNNINTDNEFLNINENLKIQDNKDLNESGSYYTNTHSLSRTNSEDSLTYSQLSCEKNIIIKTNLKLNENFVDIAKNRKNKSECSFEYLKHNLLYVEK